MISRFFVDRPIFANVIAVITVIFGVAALYTLPVERYPEITPPTVQVSTNYPGANAKVVADTVAAPIEQQINGVENMMYMSSTSSSDGSYGLTITFEIGTNLDDAQVLVQNRLSVAEPTLPEEVRRQGVTVKKQSSNIVLAISLTAPPPKYQFDLTLDPAALAAVGTTADETLTVVRGVGAESRPYLDLALDPDGMKRAGATGDDVLKALTGAGAEFRPHRDGKPGRYRVITPLAFPSDGPASAERLRGLVVAPAGRPAAKLADVARVEPVPGFYRVTVPEKFAGESETQDNGPAGADKLRRLAVRPTVPLADVARVDTLPGAYDGLFLSNYATLRLRDELSRVYGVGDVMIRGVGAYAMRIWIDPDKLAARQLTTADVIAALQRHNVQVAAGQVGQPPNPSGQRFQLTVTTLGRLSDEEQFRDIVLKSGGGGQPVYLRDVAEVNLGAQTYDSFSSRSGFSAANILIYQLPGSNALQVSKGVREAMARLKPTLPPGMEYSIPFDTTKFVGAAINEVYATLAEAGVLVLIVILVFLQSWRALLVPATTVPITIIGAFAFMPFLGFSVNLLTLFGLVLAIGIVVDDAIVIVENASHHIERGMDPRSATIQAMNEVTGPVISITLVLMAVFIPTAFLPGITGEMYRQFALTIAATALISAINALTLKPAQCAVWLRPVTGKSRFSRVFDAFYKPVERWYSWSVRQLLKVWWVILLVFVVVAVGTAVWYDRTPTSFLPEEDQGYLVIAVQLPDAASLDRTRELEQRLNTVLRETPGVENWFVLGGFSLLDGTVAPNAATAFIAWKDWKYRKTPELQYLELKKRVDIEFAQMREAIVFTLVPPSIQGLGFAGGFQLQVEDREGVGLDVLQERAQALWDAARQRSEVLSMRPLTFRAGVPQIYLDIDREKAEKMGVKLDDVFRTLQANLGSVYVNDFNKFGRTYQVRVQAEADFRGDTDTIKRLEVPGRAGLVDAEGNPLPRPHVPLGTLLSTEVTVGPQTIMRYNLYPFASLQGGPAEGVSSGQALAEVEKLADQALPATMGHEWTGIAYQEKRVGGESIMVFGLAVLLVYLVLAALYESWILPLAVILVVPLGLLGVVAAVNFRDWAGGTLPGSWLDGWLPWVGGMDNNIYTQIGIVLIIALASKNAILIVEFARELRLAGKPIHAAAAEAAKMRFRPIIMTSFAFILGVLPLVFATGAGAASRQSLGTAVCGGMITATVLAVFFVPVFYVAFQTLIELRNGPPKRPPGEELPVAGHDEAPADGSAAVETEEVPPLPEVNGEPEKNGTPGDGKEKGPEKEKAPVVEEPPPPPPAGP